MDPGSRKEDKIRKKKKGLGCISAPTLAGMRTISARATRAYRQARRVVLAENATARSLKRWSLQKMEVDEKAEVITNWIEARRELLP